MKLEEGMFVRDKDGTIAKIERIINNEIHFDIKPIFSDGECLGYNWFNIYMKNVVKASYNIIDLIEVGDLIEHENIGIKQIKDKDKYSQYIWYSKNHNPSTCDIEDAISFEAFKSEFEVGNISIVTKEQFENMSYRIEDEE